MERQHSIVRIRLWDDNAQILDDKLVQSELCAFGWVTWAKVPCVLHVDPDSECQRVGISCEHWLIEVDRTRTKSLTPHCVQTALQRGCEFGFTMKTPERINEAAADPRAAGADPRNGTRSPNPRDADRHEPTFTRSRSPLRRAYRDQGYERQSEDSSVQPVRDFPCSPSKIFKVIGSIFEKPCAFGDFAWMLKQNVHPRALYPVVITCSRVVICPNLQLHASSYSTKSKKSSRTLLTSKTGFDMLRHTFLLFQISHLI